MNSTDATIGMQLAQIGRFADALPYLDTANRSMPTDVPVLHAVASLLLWAGRIADAAERYRIAAAQLPDDIGVLSGWARALLLLGEQAQALPLIARALMLDPEYADPGGMLEKLWDTGDADAACGALHVLIDQFPQHASLLYQYAQTLLVVEHLDAARGAFERYQSLRPQDPMVCLELGRLAIYCGDTRQALLHFNRALEIDPTNAYALHEAAQAQDGRLDTATLALTHRLIQAAPGNRELAALQYMLTRHHDRSGDYGAAARHAAQVNALQQEQMPAHTRYNPLEHAREVELSIRDNTPQFFDRLRDAGSPERRPIFVIGLPRSGTTLLEQMLASHPGIVGVGEQSLADASFQRALSGSSGLPETLAASTVGEAAAWHLQMLDERVRRMAIQAGGERIVDKMPDNYLRAGWLRIAFPNAAIIHCLRDPRDVALSCWLTQFANLQWSFQLEHIADRIEKHRRLMRHWRATIGDHLTEIRYERLVADPETELRRALTAIHVDWHPDVLNFADRKGFVSSASRQQVREPLHARSVERWRNYKEALEPILPRLSAIAAQDAIEYANITL